GGSGGLQVSKIETACARRHRAIEHDQADQQDNTSQRKIDRHLPGSGAPIARPPNSNEQESGNQCQLVKGVEEKQVERSESADGASGNEKQTGVERVLVMLDFISKPDRGEEDDRAEQDHEKTKSVYAEGEVEGQLR